MVTREVIIVHADEDPPPTWDASIFLAGPMPRTVHVPSWRPGALDILGSRWTRPGRLVIFVPEHRSWQPYKYDHHTWEDRQLARADVIAFWVPRDMATMPGMNTNIEFGRWESSGRVIFGAPENAQHVGYLRESALRSGAPVAATLAETIDTALDHIGDGQYREHGDRDIPLLLWRSASFTAWQTERSKHALQAARLLWVHDIGETGPTYWALHTIMEHRAEIVISAAGNIQTYAIAPAGTT